MSLLAFAVLFAGLLCSFVYGYVNDAYNRSARVHQAELAVVCCIVALLGLTVYDIFSVVHGQAVFASRP